MDTPVLLGEESDEPIRFDAFTSEAASDAPLDHPIWPITAKIARADYHLSVLGKETRSFLDRKPYAYGHERDDEAGQYVWRVVVRELPDPRWGLLISEIAHHLNSALDHLVWLVAASHTGRRPPRDTGFPVAKGVADFRRMWTRSSGYYRIRALPPHAQAIVEDEQPYHRGNAFEGHPLWVLRRLANADKHETLVTVGGAAGKGSANVSLEGGEVAVSCQVLQRPAGRQRRSSDVATPPARPEGHGNKSRRELRQLRSVPQGKSRERPGGHADPAGTAEPR
jgi:hypothetical protein